MTRVSNQQDRALLAKSEGVVKKKIDRSPGVFFGHGLRPRIGPKGLEIFLFVGISRRTKNHFLCALCASVVKGNNFVFRSGIAIDTRTNFHHRDTGDTEGFRTSCPSGDDDGQAKP
jgi:hypothetical protein